MATWMLFIRLRPDLLACVPRRCVNGRIVAQTLVNRTWVREIQGGLSLEGLMQYVQILRTLEEVALKMRINSLGGMREVVFSLLSPLTKHSSFVL